MQKVNLAEKLGQFSEHWVPRIVGELNGQHVKLVKPTLNTGDVRNERTVESPARI